MNPLDMNGPEFLAFYILYGLIVLLATLLVRAYLRSPRSPALSARWSPGVYPREGDAYAIALLRGGPREVARTVLARLISLNLITVEGRTFRQGGGQPPPTLAPIESAAFADLLKAGSGISAHDAEWTVLSAVEPYLEPMEQDLRLQGLLPDPSVQARFESFRLLVLLVLPGLGLLKLLVAFLRGRSNIGFLIAITIAYAFALYKIFEPPRRTRAAERYLAWLCESHQGLSKLLSQGRRGHGAELALVASIYGLQAVPELSPLRNVLQPKPSTGSSSGSGGGGGSGGDSSGGDSSGGDSGGGDSGGCGGGGCGGGGCGGCGG
jgi:uncharacterized protein (TIGR04222 family)